MDTPGFPADSSSRLPRRLRIALCVCLLALTSATFAYLTTWIDPPQLPRVVTIQIAACTAWSAPKKEDAAGIFPGETTSGTTRTAIERALADVASRGRREPIVVCVSAPALQAEGGKVFLLPSDASLDDRATWLPLREVLDKLKACPAKEKLLVLELTAPPALAWSGCVYHDVGSALPRELEGVPDAHRLVLSAVGPGQKAHQSDVWGVSVFTHYVQEGLRGHADGYGDLRDGHITSKELAAFVKARVERWTAYNRGERQTPTLLGNGTDFTLSHVDDTVVPSPKQKERVATASPWQERDALHQSGEFRWMPRQFQRLLATSLQQERDGQPMLAHVWRLPLRDGVKLIGSTARRDNSAAQKSLDEQWRSLEQQLATAKPADAERIKKRFVEQIRAKLPAEERDAVVFAQALSDPRVDPGMLRLCDLIAHGSEHAQPTSAEGLRLRLLADLAMRVEVQAWPRDAVEALLRVTQAAEKAQRATPRLPDYLPLLDQPAQMRHAGELQLWARGYANLDDAKRQLLTAVEQFDRLVRLNDEWRAGEEVLDETLMELPWYVEALERLPELRAPWTQATSEARALAEALRSSEAKESSWSTTVERLATKLDAAKTHVKALTEQRHHLHAPFARDALARLERQCRASGADAAAWQNASAILSVPAPLIKVEDRVPLNEAWRLLAQRLHNDVAALDRADNDAQRQTSNSDAKMASPEDETRLAGLRTQWQLALLELAGMDEARLKPLRQRIHQCKADARNPVGWCELGAEFRLILTRELPKQFAEETSWRERERIAWVAPPLASLGEIDLTELSPTLEQQQQMQEQRDNWLASLQRYLTREYAGFNLESPGILGARGYYAKAVGERNLKDAYLQLGVAATVEPLTEKQPYAHLTLEVTHHVPPGAYGPIELRFHRTDDAWLEITPDAVTLPALTDAKASRKIAHTVPLKVSRKERAERTGLPPPVGFMVEARFAGRSYHHLVKVPVIPSAQQLHILVSADPDEPMTTLHEIRVRPGKVKQPYYIYVKNLTNRAQKVHVEVKAGDALVHRSQRLLTIEPDTVRKVPFDEAAVRIAELRGPLSVRVLDAERQKVLDERTLRIDVLAPHEYVKAEEAIFEPGSNGQSKWSVHVQPIKSVSGPAIAAQLILPVQRIPGLLGVGGGTLKLELPTHTKTPHTLFAERLNLAAGAEEEGPVYLHIDGVPRAFVYRTTFTRAGQPSQPRVDDRPAVRLGAPPCVMAGINCLVDIEVDNAPRGAKLEVALGRVSDTGLFKAEIVREFADARKRRIDLEAAKDALIFDATIADWTATFDTRSIVGPRHLQARLLDANGKELASADQTLIIDDSPPVARLAPAPAQVKRGSILQVYAQGVDAETGVAQVMFFIGQPDKGEIPQKAPKFKGLPTNREGTQWSTSLRVPIDHVGPLAVSVHVVNHAGLASVDTMVVDVVDRDPGPAPVKTGVGRIEGKVVEGLRPQPNLDVILLDPAGKEITRTKTQADGTYAIDQVAPGRYRVLCVKPESQRRATIDVLVTPDAKTRGDLSLSL